jgi:hypothetical protein
MTHFLLIFAVVSAVVLALHLCLGAGIPRNLRRDAVRRKAVKGGAQRAGLRAEVVVTLRDEAEGLPALLVSLARQTDGECLFLFIEDRSQDGTAEMLD